MKEIEIAVREMVFLDISELVPFQGDLKTLTEERYLALRAEILERKFSFAFHAWNNAPDGKRYVGDGHQRLRVLTRMRQDGWRVPPVPVVLVDARDEQEFRLKVLAAIAQYGEIDRQGLYEFAELGQIPIETLEQYPLPDLDMPKFRAEFYDDPPASAGGDSTPPVPPQPKSRPGDLWKLGRHRLLCGDSTKAEDVQRATLGFAFDACITDPPYGVNYDQSHKSNERGGDPVVHGGDPVVHGGYTWDAAATIGDVLTFLKLVPSDVLVMSFPVDRHFFDLADALRAANFEVRKELVWVKDVFSFWMGAKYQQRHEPILWCARPGKPMGGDVPSNVSTVLEYPRPRAHDLHPTAKPLDLWELLVRHHVAEGEAVYEPFSGSGTTIMAAQNTGRTCVAIEKSPQYVDVALQRFAEATGIDPTRHDGVPWSKL